ncbi:MAG TPA: lysophospholipid acyltransferase family protein [Candidatus Udaeobacter sp.]|nr:lysophospholipid acyltransferase family protein [Candidatus Udaeobacter sp.]
MIPFLLYKLGSLLTRLLPYRIVYFVAACISDLNYAVNRRSRRAVFANLRHVLAKHPPAEPMDAIARRVFRNFALNIVDFLRLPLVDQAEMQRVIRVEGWEHAEQAGAAGGVIFLSCHLGNWEWAGITCAQMGFKMKAVALDHGAGRVTRFFSERRRSKGVEPLPLSGSTFAMIDWLRTGGAVGVIADRDYAHQGMEVTFFDAPAIMPRAHAILAIKTGAPIVPCFLLREASDHFRMIFEPPVYAGDFQHLEADFRVRAILERCLRTFEDVIAHHPDQWFVFEPLWQTDQGAGR